MQRGCTKRIWVDSHAPLSGAGRALGLAQPTIGRHLQALEGALGIALFTVTLVVVVFEHEGGKAGRKDQ
jgi:DNA-binding transcriptional LysR family regulator